MRCLGGSRLLRSGGGEGGGVEEKLGIVAKCDRSGAAPADVTRRYDISTRLLHVWKRTAQGRPARSAESFALVPVHVAEPRATAEGRPPRATWLEIGLPGGILLKVDSGVNPEALAAIVGVLPRR